MLHAVVLRQYRRMLLRDVPLRDQVSSEWALSVHNANRGEVKFNIVACVVEALWALHFEPRSSAVWSYQGQDIDVLSITQARFSHVLRDACCQLSVLRATLTRSSLSGITFGIDRDKTQALLKSLRDPYELARLRALLGGGFVWPDRRVHQHPALSLCPGCHGRHVQQHILWVPSDLGPLLEFTCALCVEEACS